MHHPTDRITYHGLIYTSRGTLAATRNSSMVSEIEEGMYVSPQMTLRSNAGFNVLISN